jgi:predicted dehydrogenase
MIENLQALVVGYGSIGARHSDALTGLGIEVEIVSRRRHVGKYDTVTEAINGTEVDYVVIATETEHHLQAVTELIHGGYRGRVLVEKPYAPFPLKAPEHSFRSLGVGYHLRFHPAVTAFRNALHGEVILSAHVRVGSYLPSWRVGRDYRQTASASEGGGVVLDLSHELDLVYWLLGPGEIDYGKTFHSGSLEILNEDLAIAVILLNEGAPVCVQMSYLDRKPIWTFVVITQTATVRLDLITGTCEIDDMAVYAEDIGRDDVYSAMHHGVLVDDPRVCGMHEALAVLEWAEKIKNGTDLRV